MKRKSISILCVLFALLFLSGCGSLRRVKGVEYDLTEGEGESATLFVVRGNPGLELISFNDWRFPKTRRNIVWDPLYVPANEEFTLRVHAKHEVKGGGGSSIFDLFVIAAAIAGDVNKKVDFRCPPLEANTTYILTFELAKKGQRTALVLTNAKTDERVYIQEI